MTRHQLGMFAATALATLVFATTGASAGGKALAAGESLGEAQAGKFANPHISFKIDNRMKNKLNAMQWSMVAGSEGRQVLSGNQYRMVNSVKQAGIKRQKRTIAANLGWLSKGSNDFNVRIKRQAGDGQVRYGEVVALELKSYGWLRYKKQKAGINLSDDDNKPHYIWVITGGTPGTKLVSGMPFALYNTTERAEITYCNRSMGIDLGWYHKSKCDSRFATLSNIVMGPNGLLARDGASGAAFVMVKNHICEAAVGALVAEATVKTGGAAGPLLVAAGDKAITACKKL